MFIDNDIKKMKFVIAGYDLPAVYAIQQLFSQVVKPEQILLITHQEDARNITLLSFARLRKIEILFFDPNSKELLEKYKSFKPDILFSIHFREKIPNKFLQVPKFGAVNIHPSLLPSYRGTNSIPWQIINGENITGYSWHYMDEHFDTGNIILQEKINITSDETAFSLFHKQIILSVGKFIEEVENFFETKKSTNNLP
jgi:methionyl-tRNA formyltransferase